MKKNLLNKNIVIYQVLQKGKSFNNLICISLQFGWILIPLVSFWNKQLKSILTGYLRIYKYNFKIKGFGFKWKYFWYSNHLKSKIYLKLGLTHRIVFIILKNMKCKVKKKRLILRHRSYVFIRNMFNILFFCFKTYLFNKKGIYARGTKWKLKLSKKKSKF